MSGDGSVVVRITQRELLMEVRDDVRALRDAVDAVARDQMLGVERRAGLQRTADGISSRLDTGERAILDLQRWRDEAAGAMKLARWAFGTSLVATVLIILQIVAQAARLADPRLS